MVFVGVSGLVLLIVCGQALLFPVANWASERLDLWRMQRTIRRRAGLK